jgi:hypothetical protein
MKDESRPACFFPSGFILHPSDFILSLVLVLGLPAEVKEDSEEDQQQDDHDDDEVPGREEIHRVLSFSLPEFLVM